MSKAIIIPSTLHLLSRRCLRRAGSDMNEGDDEDTFYSYLALHVCFFLVYCKWCNRCIWFFWCNSSFALLLKAMCLFMTVVILCAHLYVCECVFQQGHVHVVRCCCCCWCCIDAQDRAYHLVSHTKWGTVLGFILLRRRNRRTQR